MIKSFKDPLMKEQKWYSNTKIEIWIDIDTIYHMTIVREEEWKQYCAFRYIYMHMVFYGYYGNDGCIEKMCIK